MVMAFDHVHYTFGMKPAASQQHCLGRGMSPSYYRKSGKQQQTNECIVNDCINKTHCETNHSYTNSLLIDNINHNIRHYEVLKLHIDGFALTPHNSSFS